MILINPFYETIDSVRQFLSIGPKAIDVDKYEREEKTLVIIDSLEKYTGQKKELEVTREEGKRKESILKVGEMKDESNWWLDNEQMIKHARH